MAHGEAPSGERELRCRGRFWIRGEDETFLGYGRVVLLERIREYGSITKAAASMDMSYRHAWELVSSMNSQSTRPLVEKIVGGKAGGGAKLTDEGERMIRVYWKLFALHQVFLEEIQPEMERLLQGATPRDDLG